MRINAIKPVRTRKHKAATDSHHRLGVAAHWLDSAFVAGAPNRQWAGDITYVWTLEGWLYLAVILAPDDLGSTVGRRSGIPVVVHPVVPRKLTYRNISLARSHRMNSLLKTHN